MPTDGRDGPTFTQSLLAGGIAGTTVDLSLYPIDTLKTRLQSAAGFSASGGFRGVYAGVGSAVVGSAPGAALFFVTYDGINSYYAERRRTSPSSTSSEAVEHMIAASLGEIAACAVRVPTEVVKQRAQASAHRSSRAALAGILATRHGKGGLLGVWSEMYRGWSITVLREVPFTIIQFPLWEALKRWGVKRRGGGKEERATAAESAVFGCVSGAVAAAATTPLDVLKTRLMLAKEKTSVFTMARSIWVQAGPGAFFAGIGPRCGWISAGGAIFLGAYQWASNALGGIV